MNERPPDHEAYRPLSGRRRLLILLLAVATAVAIMLSVLAPPGASKTPRPQRQEPTACAPGQTAGCLGGKAEVIAPAASR